MGHDIHFLQRLERVAMQHMELAMSLYNDPALLLHILDRLRLPESAERVSISLADPINGPFLIVARDGHFVTCLGEGMSVGDLPVVPRSQLDALMDHVADQRARIDMARLHGDQNGKFGKLMSRLYTAGNTLSREEFIALSAFAPLMVPQYISELHRLMGDLAQTRIVLGKIRERPQPKQLPLLRAYHQTLHAVGHLSLLLGMHGRAWLEEVVGVHEWLAQGTMSWPAVRQGVLSVSLRGAWLSGRFGKLTLPACRNGLTKLVSPLICNNLMYSLLAVAARHSRLRGEVRKLLRSERLITDPSYEDYQRSQFKSAANMVDRMVEGDEDPIAFSHKVAGELFRRCVAARSPDPALVYEQPTDVPLPLCVALLCDMDAVDILDADVCLQAIIHLPAIAQAAPEDFYFPAAILPALHQPYVPTSVIRLIRTHHILFEGVRQVRAAPRPGRNDPCPCGSGQKYKRCHEGKPLAQAHPQDTDSTEPGPAEPG